MLGLIVFLILCLAVSGFGGTITATSFGTWYQVLEKPPFNPPDWVFALVWTTLHILMGIAAWRVWRLGRSETGRTALAVFAVQLVLNLAWSFLFFGLQRIGWGLVEIVVLFLAIIANAFMFWRIGRLAGMLFVPLPLGSLTRQYSMPLFGCSTLPSDRGPARILRGRHEKRVRWQPARYVEAA